MVRLRFAGRLVVAALVSFYLFSAFAEERVPLADLAVRALAPADGRAIVQMPDGALRPLAVGDEIPEAGVRVRQVLPDRLVVDETTAPEGRARRRIWIFRAGPGERSRVQVLDPEPGGRG